MKYGKTSSQEILDMEWASLIVDARTMGMSTDEIRSVLMELQATSSFEWRMEVAVSSD